MAVLKNQIKLHKFTAPTAENITAGAGTNTTNAAADSDTGGKKGGETLKIPDLLTLTTFVKLIDIWDDIANGFEPDLTLSEAYYFDEFPHIFAEHSHLRALIDVLDEIDDNEQRETILAAIQHQAYNVAECIADEYPVMKPFFEDYLKRVVS